LAELGMDIELSFFDCYCLLGSYLAFGSSCLVPVTSLKLSDRLAASLITAAAIDVGFEIWVPRQPYGRSSSLSLSNKYRQLAAVLV
jgi:hypothetical protein